MNAYIQDTKFCHLFFLFFSAYVLDKCFAKRIFQTWNRYHSITEKEIELAADTEKAKLHKHCSFVRFFKENDLQAKKGKNDEEVNVRRL